MRTYRHEGYHGSLRLQSLGLLRLVTRLMGRVSISPHITCWFAVFVCCVKACKNQGEHQLVVDYICRLDVCRRLVNKGLSLQGLGFRM